VFGASGFVKMVAPLPTLETKEFPYKFVAYTLAKILDPQGRLNGAALRVAVGIVQLVVSITSTLPPWQFVISVLNVTPSTY